MSMRYLLDTNICIYILKQNPPQVRRHFEAHATSEIGMSTITWGELLFGAEKSYAREKTLAGLNQLRRHLQVLPLQAEVGRHYGEIRAQLQAKGQIIGNNDLWLAAHARCNDWQLVTDNVREFERVPGLSVANWAEE